MPLNDQTIYRVYQCDNEECEAQLEVKETVGDPWQKECPFCKKNSLFLKSAHMNMSIFIDHSKPKTLGSLGEKNYEEAVKNGTIQPKKKEPKPFWRKTDKINYNILKNPNKYVKEGYV